MHGTPQKSVPSKWSESELDQRFGVVGPNWLRGSRLFPDVDVNRSAKCLATWSDGQTEVMMHELMGIN